MDPLSPDLTAGITLGIMFVQIAAVLIAVVMTQVFRVVSAVIVFVNVSLLAAVVVSGVGMPPMFFLVQLLVLASPVGWIMDELNNRPAPEKEELSPQDKLRQELKNGS